MLALFSVTYLKKKKEKITRPDSRLFSETVNDQFCVNGHK